jgi:hypothetical protein
MANPKPIDWTQWHSLVLDRMSVILARAGKLQNFEYEDVRKAEIRAIAELRRERVRA